MVTRHFHKRGDLSEKAIVDSYFNQPRMPTAEAIHWSTMRYIADDFHRNGHKYAPADRERIFNLIKNC
jgi:hypothetical protein